MNKVKEDLMDILIRGAIWLLTAYNLMILVCVLLTLFPELQRNKVAGILSRLVDPVLAPFRKLIPPIGNLDITALVVMLLIQIAISGLLRW